MTKFGAAENEMERLTAKFAQRTPTEQSLFGSGKNFGFGRKFWFWTKILSSCENFRFGRKFWFGAKNFGLGENFAFG